MMDKRAVSEVSVAQMIRKQVYLESKQERKLRRLADLWGCSKRFSKTAAEGLLFSQQLRAYDALQIASTLQATRYFPHSLSELRFCTADQQQATAAANQGLTVEFIA
jgi:hypothetical protein